MAVPTTSRPLSGLSRLVRKISFSPRWVDLAWLLLFILLAPGLIQFLTHSWQVLNWEWQIDYDEGFNLDASWKLANGVNIYGAAQPGRFIAAPYPPVYYLLCAAFQKFSGYSLLGGRLISFGAALAIGLFIFLFGRKLARDFFRLGRLDATLAGLLGLFTWFSLNVTIVWGTFYKQDMLALALASAGLWFTLRWTETGGKFWPMLLPAGLLALGFYTKQNELAALGGAWLYMVLKDWRRGLRFGLTLAGILAVPFLALDVATRHRFYFEVFVAQQVPWVWDDFWRRMTTRIIPDHLLLILLAVAFAFAALTSLVRAWLAKKWRVPPLELIWLATGTFTLVTVGSYQSGYNHALDFFPPMVVAAAGSFGWLLTYAFQPGLTRSRQLGFSIAALAVTAGLAWQILTYPSPGLYYSPGNMPSQVRREMYEGLVKQVAQAPGDILSEDIYLQLKTGRPVVYDDLYHMALQAAAGQWDESQFLADLRARRFSVVLLGQGSRRFTDAGWAALNTNYRLIFPDGLALWRPRPQPLLPQHAVSCQVGSSINFQGVSYGRNTTDNTLSLTTYWQTSAKPDADYTLYVHLLDPSGKPVAQRDSPPDGWSLLDPQALVRDGLDLPQPQALPLPTTGWKVGNSLLVDQTLPLPAGLNLTKDYRLIVGVYSVDASGKINSLPVNCAQPGVGAGDTINLPPPNP